MAYEIRSLDEDVHDDHRDESIDDGNQHQQRDHLYLIIKYLV